MQKELNEKNESISYSVKVSSRAKKMRIAVYCDSSVVVTLPFGLDVIKAEQFIKEKALWIKRTLERFRPFTNKPITKSGRQEYKKLRAVAQQLAEEKVGQWNKIYGFNYNRVNIKNQKTRWGSCSKKGNLNFNYKILQLPERVLDYLIVHELCHLKEFNHSKNFWNLISQTLPDYKNLRLQLKNFS